MYYGYQREQKPTFFLLNLVIILWSKKLEYIEKRFIHEPDNIFLKKIHGTNIIIYILLILVKRGVGSPKMA